MMTKRNEDEKMQIDFIFDLASPNAYFVHKMLPNIELNTGASFNYVPCLLGGIFKETGNKAPFEAFAGVKNKIAYERLEIQRFIQEHNLTDFVFNQHFPINTLFLMRCAAAESLKGTAELKKFIDTALHHIWEKSANMNDPEVAAKILIQSGYDFADLTLRANSKDTKALLVANTKSAVARGAFGIPTIFVGEQIFFGKERLSQVEQEIKRQTQDEK